MTRTVAQTLPAKAIHRNLTTPTKIDWNASSLQNLTSLSLDPTKIGANEVRATATTTKTRSSKPSKIRQAAAPRWLTI